MARKNEYPNKKKATFFINEELHTELKIISAKQGRSMAEILEEVLDKYLKKFR